MFIKELSNEEFNTFTDNYTNYSIYQTSEYAFVMNNQDFECMYLGLIDDYNNILAASLILIEKNMGFKYAYAPNGFLIDYNNIELLKEFTKLIKKYLGKKNIIAIKINPRIIRSSYEPKSDITQLNNNFDEVFNNLKKLGYYHLGFNNFFEALKPRYEAILEINKSINELFLNLKKNLRSEIKVADKSGIRIYKGNLEDLKYLYFQTKQKYPRDLSYFEDVYKFYSKRGKTDFFFAKLNTKIYLVYIQKQYKKQNELCDKINEKLFKNKNGNNNELINRKIKEENRLANLKNELIYATNLLKDYPDGIILASALLLKHRDEVYLLMDGYDKTYKKFNAKHLLIWKLIERYSNLKFNKFNLGGMSNFKENNKKYNGLNKFKLNYNAKCIEYIGDLELITNKPLYIIYRNSSPIRNILKK